MTSGLYDNYVKTSLSLRPAAEKFPSQEHDSSLLFVNEPNDYHKAVLAKRAIYKNTKERRKRQETFEMERFYEQLYDTYEHVEEDNTRLKRSASVPLGNYNRNSIIEKYDFGKRALEKNLPSKYEMGSSLAISNLTNSIKSLHASRIKKIIQREEKRNIEQFKSTVEHKEKLEHLRLEPIRRNSNTPQRITHAEQIVIHPPLVKAETPKIKKKKVNFKEQQSPTGESSPLNHVQPVNQSNISTILQVKPELPPPKKQEVVEVEIKKEEKKEKRVILPSLLPSNNRVNSICMWPEDSPRYPLEDDISNFVNENE